MGYHAKGCQGREYVCTCGHDEELSSTASELLKALKDCVDRFTAAFPAAENYAPIKNARAAIWKAEKTL